MPWTGPFITKPVKIASDRIKPELHAQYGVTDPQKLESGRVSLKLPDLQVPDYPNLDAMVQDLGCGDEAAGKAEVFKIAKAQQITNLANSYRESFQKPATSTSVSQAEALTWALANDKAGFSAQVNAGDATALDNYLTGVKAKILAERQAAVANGTAIPAETEEAPVA